VAQTCFFNLRRLQVSLLSYNKLLLLHDLLSWPMSHHCVWGGLTPEKRDTVLPRLRACDQSSTYNWHLSLFWVSVTYTLTRCSITVTPLVGLVPRSNITLLLS